MFGLHLHDFLKSVKDSVASLLPLGSGAAGSHGASRTSGFGTVDTFAVLLGVPRDVVELLLPDDGLELEQQTVVPFPWHPVLMLFSHFTFPKDKNPVAMNYNELIVSVPFTRHPVSFNVKAGGHDDPPFGPLTYITRFYLDHRLPTMLGNELFGFEKLISPIVNTGERFLVTTGRGERVVEGSFSPRTSGADTADKVPRFDLFRELFAQKTVSQSGRAFIENARHHNSPFLYSYLDFFPGGREPTVREVDAVVTVTKRFSPRGFVTSPTDPASFIERAFHVHGEFELSLPFVKPHGPERPPRTHRKRHVVVIGGGPSACAAAFHLAKQRDRYDVTMYTQGFRLGGKCMAWPNPAKNSRVEEHGLHALVGFYRDMPRTLAEVYKVAYGPGSEARELTDRSLIKENHTGLMSSDDAGNWAFLPSPVYPDGAAIAVELFDAIPLADKLLWGAMRHIEKAVERLRSSRVSTVLETVKGLFTGAIGLNALGLAGFDVAASNLVAAVTTVEQSVDELLARPLAVFERLLGRVKDVSDPSIAEASVATTARGARAFAKLLWGDVAPTDPEFFVWTGIDTLLTALVGLNEDHITHYDALDDYDYREWLHNHGSSEGRAKWPVISFVYETLFASQDDSNGPPVRMAAGVALRWFVHTAFLTEDAPALRFRWSSGRTIFSPYYEALTNLGVKIHFFSVLVGLETTGTGAHRTVTKLRFQKQAELKGGDYNPLVSPAKVEKLVDWNVKDWQFEPDLSQITEYDSGIDYFDRWQFVEDPTRQFEVPQRAVDPTDSGAFDDCILAIPAATVKLLSTDLLDPGPAGDPRWREMVNVDAVQTRSMQLWFKPSFDQLYTGLERRLTTDFEQPEPSFGDFTHLGKSEDWNATTPEPGLTAYFCGCLPPSVVAPAYEAAHASYPHDQKTAFRAAARAWLDSAGGAFFDRVPPGKLEQQLVWDSYDEQYYVAAVQPQDLYYISAVGQTEQRLRQAETGVRHLLIAGDWTRTDWNAGCVEAATQSGMMAAHAISGAITTMHRVGF